jgi:hypothetical protein
MFESIRVGNTPGMDQSTDSRRESAEAAREEPIDVRSVELEDDDGNPVVIAQQNVGPGNQVGGGEFKTPPPPKDPGQAAEEQADLDEGHAGTHDGHSAS